MTFLDSVPWFLPGLVLSIGLGFAMNRRLAAALAISRTYATVAIVSLGLIASATLTPLRAAIESGATGSGSCDLSRVGLASLNDLMAVTVNDSLLNVLLFVPLGFAIGLAPRSTRMALFALAAGALPFAIEATQLFVTSLARGCETGDIADNLSGLALGYAAGFLLARARPRTSRATRQSRWQSPRRRTRRMPAVRRDTE